MGINVQESHDDTEDDNIDLAKWTKGGEQFHEFWRKIGSPQLSQDLKGPLQAVFLGEKPSCLDATINLEDDEILKEFGLKREGRYIYDPKQVEAVIARHSEVFQQHNLRTAEDTMRWLNKTSLTEGAVERGLILGIPLTAIRDYIMYSSLSINNIIINLHNLLVSLNLQADLLEETYFTGNILQGRQFIEESLQQHTEQLGIQTRDIPRLMEEVDVLIQRRTVNVYGVTWVEQGESSESIQRQSKLRNAFEKSGILV